MSNAPKEIIERLLAEAVHHRKKMYFHIKASLCYNSTLLTICTLVTVKYIVEHRYLMASFEAVPTIAFAFLLVKAWNLL